jgi:hypothetical protein
MGRRREKEVNREESAFFSFLQHADIFMVKGPQPYARSCWVWY